MAVEHSRIKLNYKLLTVLPVTPNIHHSVYPTARLNALPLK